ncbi:MAG: chemotaxis protein CheX [Syntrophorhabdaceae bacterium]|nr:chemotaxis protein CheX [Syntrophorhabdaceae bacterium]
MDVQYINPFIVAAQTVFKTMLSINIDMGKPQLKNTCVTSGDITGIMGLAGDKKGTVAISLREQGAKYIYKTLIGDECDGITQDVVDAVGEITNIISGQARKEFEKKGINLNAAIPMVIVGKRVEMNFITKLPIISLPFYFSLNNGHDGEKEVVYIDFSFE